LLVPVVEPVVAAVEVPVEPVVAFVDPAEPEVFDSDAFEVEALPLQPTEPARATPAITSVDRSFFTGFFL